MKLRGKHGEITFQHYRYMPHLLLDGFVAPSHKRPRHVELWWFDTKAAAPTAFLAVLKATKANEVFVGTFHPLHRREARRLVRRATRDDRLMRSQAGYTDLHEI